MKKALLLLVALFLVAGCVSEVIRVFETMPPVPYPQIPQIFPSTQPK